jgi:hypothetical protein
MEINGNYVLDIDNIINFCFKNDNTSTDSEKTEMYMLDEENGDMVLASRQVREVKNGDLTNLQTLKYDLVKNFIADLMNINENDITFGDSVIINTMINENFLKEVN